MRWRSLLFAALLLLAAALPSALRAQQEGALPVAELVRGDAARDSVMFSFERPGLPVPKFLLALWETGEGHYGGEEVPTGARSSDPPPAPQPFGMTIFNVSPSTARKVFTLARDLKQFNFPCASKAKNVADTGKKTLTYSGVNATTSCTYNYSENKNVQALTELFQGLAETMDEGRKLDYLHRYDRLGLDAEITYLAQEVTAGRALEVGTIAESLRSIAADAEVIQRVRTRANSLLAQLPDGSAQAMPTQN
jgi:hypothetical protein